MEPENGDTGVIAMAEDENVIYVGNKPVTNYVLAVMTQFSEGADEVKLVARGRAISRAVDVAEFIRNNVMPEVEVKDIEIGTEEIETEEGDTISVSTIAITLAKPSE